jgi:TIR domain-containing protein/von Hippel-Lindau disease tumor suppressor protein
VSDVFVSYRRADSPDVTGRICDQLLARLGPDHLFRDIESIPLGRDFRTAIAEAVGSCAVLLAVIGRDWLRAAGEDERRRIDDPNDFVHIEIASALQRGIPVIPVLVEGAAMPRAAELPAPLADLAFRTGTQVRADPDFQADIARLGAELAKYLPADRERRPASRRWDQLIPASVRRWKLLLQASALAIALAGLVLAVRSCDRWVQADCSNPSREGGTPVSVVFVNESRHSVVVNWVDYKGIEQPQSGGLLDPGARFTTRTHTGHAWCVRTRETNRAVVAPVIDVDTTTIAIH